MSAADIHIAFVINSLVGGGAERALVNIIKGLEGDVARCRVSLILLDTLPEAHAVPPFVEKHVLDSGEKLGRSIINLARLMRSIKPDVAVSFLARSNCANVVAGRLAGYPAIISERVHTSNHFGAGLGASLQKLIIRLFYRHAAKVIAVSSGVERDLVRNFGLDPSRVTVIHNPIDLMKLGGLAGEAFSAAVLPDDYIVAVGRLVPNKNFAMMLRAFARSGIPGSLVIMGEGPERAALEALTSELGLSGRVVMPGYVANPFPAIAGAKYLVSSSNAEGFPNALVEAMALGRPVISTDCEAGPADILSPDHGPSKTAVTRAAYGLLVPMERADLLADAMKMFEDRTVLTEFGRLAQLRVVSYAPEKICKHYWEAISSLIQRPANREDRSAGTAANSESGPSSSC